jgi:DNA-binding MarR family transcriptional regulator
MAEYASLFRHLFGSDAVTSQKGEMVPQAKTSPADVTELPGQVESGGGIDMGILPSLMGYMLRQGQLCVYHDFFETLAAENIRPPQFSILEVVSRNPGIRPSDVAAVIGVKRANLVPLVAALEQRGFLSRTSSSGDRRAQALQLTAEGKERLKHWHTLVLPHEDRLAARLGPDGRAQLIKLLQALVRG